MKEQSAIGVHGLGKCYRFYARPIDRLVQGMVGRGRRLHEEFWALRGIDLEIGRGETVGIVGRNGSGKSTLLQLIAGTLTPTEGSIEVRGRVAALLELGSGFNPDFTGRENVRLYASVLGLSADEIDAGFDRMVDFAEIGEFIDQSLRTYSTGMCMRLAFAVSICVEPDVFIIDEALSVGDAAFQRKCHARIERLKRRGTTILFVSHATGSVVELCDRAVLLENGRRILSGPPKPVVSLYQKLLYAPGVHRAAVVEEIAAADRDGVPAEAGGHDPGRPMAMDDRDAGTAERLEPTPAPSSAIEYPSRGARIQDPKIFNAAGRQVNVLVAGQEYIYSYEVKFDRDCAGVRFGMMIKNIAGVELFGMASHAHGESIPCVQAGHTCRVEFRFIALLQRGAYFMNAGCTSVYEQHGFLHRIVDALMFRVEPVSSRVMAGYADLSVEPACRITTAADSVEVAA